MLEREVLEHDFLSRGIADEMDVFPGERQVSTAIDGMFVDAVVVAGDHHDRPSEPAQLADVFATASSRTRELSKRSPAMNTMSTSHSTAMSTVTPRPR